LKRGRNDAKGGFSPLVVMRFAMGGDWPYVSNDSHAEAPLAAVAERRDLRLLHSGGYKKGQLFP